MSVVFGSPSESTPPSYTTRSDWLQQKRFSLDLDNFMCKWEIDIHSKLSYIDHSSSDRMSVDLPKSLPLRSYMCFYLLSFFISFIQNEKKHIGDVCYTLYHQPLDKMLDWLGWCETWRVTLYFPNVPAKRCRQFSRRLCDDREMYGIRLVVNWFSD